MSTPSDHARPNSPDQRTVLTVKVSTIRNTSVALLVCAVVAFIANVVSVVVNAEVGFNLIMAGVWVGALVLTTGGIGLGGASCKSVPLVVAYLVLCIITAALLLVSFAQGILSLVNAETYEEHYYYYFYGKHEKEIKYGQFVADIIFLAATLVEFIAAIWGAAASCQQSTNMTGLNTTKLVAPMLRQQVGCARKSYCTTVPVHFVQQPNGCFVVAQPNGHSMHYGNGMLMMQTQYPTHTGVYMQQTGQTMYQQHGAMGGGPYQQHGAMGGPYQYGGAHQPNGCVVNIPPATAPMQAGAREEKQQMPPPYEPAQGNPGADTVVHK